MLGRAAHEGVYVLVCQYPLTRLQNVIREVRVMLLLLVSTD